MENKINIAELLKDCPMGMELDSPVYYNLTFDYINEEQGRIYCKTEDRDTTWFTIYGCVSKCPSSKCVIFPKGKTTWEGFVPPCKFKDGDIISNSFATCIFKGQGVIKGTVDYYCGVDDSDFHFKPKNKGHYGYIDDYSLATEEEKQKLFDVIKENGYKWNAETKTLDKLPKFKVGDRVKDKNNFTYTVLSIEGWGYILDDLHRTYVSFDDQDNYELVPNKFDITTLIPFESIVLVRSSYGDIWRPAIYGFANSGKHYVVGGIYWMQCIPYEVNKELLGTTNDCDEYYKTW